MKLVQSKDSLEELSLSELNLLREMLEQQRGDLLQKMQMGEGVVSGPKGGDEAEVASQDMSTFQQLRFRSRELLYEKKVERALKRIQENEYGICSECHGPIGFHRLRARPAAELCIHCKEEAERDELGTAGHRRTGQLIDFVRFNRPSYS